MGPLELSAQEFSPSQFPFCLTIYTSLRGIITHSKEFRMAIDVFTEEVLTFPQATKRLPHLRSGKKLHISTIWRWTVAGKKCPDGSVTRLETIKIGGSTCTSLEALQRFFTRLTGDRQIVTPPTPTARQRQKQIDEAARYLDEELGR